MRRITISGLLLAPIAAAMLLSCRPAPRGEQKIVIGLAVPSLTHPFFIHLKNRVMDEAGRLGVQVITADAEDTAAKQMAIVEDFIARGVDGVLISPIGADALVPAIEALHEARIPVATVDRMVRGGDVLVHVGADNVRGGELAAQYIIQRLGGKGSVIELEGTPGASPAIDRKRGFDAAIRKAGIALLASQAADFQRAKGQTVMENLLQVHREFSAVYAANDEMILGAIEAMEAHHMDPAAVVTVGYDAIPDALEYIRAGRLDATVEQYPGRQASTALRILVEYLREGKSPPRKEIYIEPVVIEARNLQEAEFKGPRNP